LDLLLGTAPTPETVLILEEENRRLMGLLRDDQLRRIALSRIEGYTIVEIADELTLSTRSIERKLRLIRNAWTKEFIHAEQWSSVD
jgi:DNA-directed RNA polymerase specialized sigma24 family protein